MVKRKGAKRSGGSQPRDGYLPMSGGPSATPGIGQWVGPPPALIKPADPRYIPNWGTQTSGETKAPSNKAPNVSVDRIAPGTKGPVNPLTKSKGKQPTQPKSKQKVKPGSAGAPIQTRVEGQPVYGTVQFGRVEPSLAQGGVKRGWKRVTPDKTKINSQRVEYLIPNIRRNNRFSGEPSYWLVTEENLRTLIRSNRGTKSQQALQVDAGAIQSIIEQSFKKQPGLYVNRFEEDAIAAATGLAPDIRARGFKEADGATIFFGNAADQIIYSDDGPVGPVDTRRGVKIEVPKPGSGEVVFEAPPSQPEIGDEPRGTYYFEKGRFLTRGKYNARNAFSTTQR